ncbi:ankyrin repeat domain-containing protein 45 isoform X2 [Rhinatrema bivittatum]|uniref:ankyrin repeat domain-containing protein 45 isoform X2 n=1 Tax=Rhinatrema bivittatum TaxID=194408 RepID=UPI00112BBDA6|nr:ankyrin repeat domain-containing protein 45 isoform X2 [Rhinatrema bivittatum]
MEPEPSPSILLNCVLEGDEEELPKLLGDVGNPRHKKMLQHLMEQDVAGRSIVHIACMMGRSNIIQEFAKNGVSLNEKTARGYLPIHFAAAWGHLETLHTLVELGADLEGLNFLDERAREIAFRYSKMDCVDFLDWAEEDETFLETTSKFSKHRASFCKPLAREKSLIACNTRMGAESAPEEEESGRHRGRICADAMDSEKVGAFSLPISLPIATPPMQRCDTLENEAHNLMHQIY